VAEESKPDRRELFEREKTRFGTAVNMAIAVSKAAAGRMPDADTLPSFQASPRGGHENER
jgi:hypothetical protein